MKKIFTVPALFAALTVAAAFPAIAGTEIGNSNDVSLVAPAANTGAVAISEQASTVRDNRKPGGHTLRCWNQGRLLYEGSGFRHDVDKTSSVINVQRVDGDGAVVILDLKDGVCMLTKS